MGKIVKLVATAGAFIVGGPQAAAAVGAGLTALGIGNPKKPKISQAAVDRQNVSINPTAPRTMIFGRTSMATDLRYQSYTGANQEFYNQIIVCAAHKVTSIEELWIGDQQAWTVGGGVLAPFIGYLTVTPVLEGSAANMVNIDGVWNAANNRRLTGCAYMWIQYKRTGNSKKSESPFASDITSRLTIIGKGMPLYCPRRDSTVPGGSGTMRINDQSTWAFAVGADEIGRNPALVELAYKIGWRIGGVVSVGRGMPSRRISLQSYIAAANLCDESVSITGGGTEPRYRLDGIYDESQGGLEVLGAIHATMDARHRDDGGQLSLHVMHNDLSAPTLTFTADDILGPVDWDVWPLSLEDDRNIGRGRFTDARPNSLYQLSDFGEIVSASIDGNDRILSEDFAEVQSASQARRLVRRKLQRLKFPGIMSFEAGARAYAVKVGDPVWLSFPNLAMVNKRFRVRSRSVTLSARVEIVLSEEDGAIYPTGAEDGAPITPTPPTTYDFMNNALIAQLATIETGADVTADAFPDIDGNTTWVIDANAAGTITTGLPLPRRFKAMLGGVDVSSTTSFAVTTTGLVAATVNDTAGADRGVVTLGSATTGAGTISLTATFANGAVKNVVIIVTVNRAAMTSGGGAGATSGSVGTNANFSTSSFVAVTPEIQIMATAGGTVKAAFDTSYTAAAGVTGRAQIRVAQTAGGGAVAQSADTLGTAYIVNDEAGQVAIGEAVYSGLTPSAPCFVQGFMRRSSGSGTVTPSGTLTAMQ